jgi:murein DD-endopeptidase MepM/ murein hydrolase activator NlpD
MGFLAAIVNSDAAIMKIIRANVLAITALSYSFLSLTTPAYAQKMFVEQIVDTPKVATAEPELKQVLPLIFNQTKPELVTNTEDKDAEIFAPLFVDKTDGEIHQSYSTEKVEPIHTEAMKGISSFFTSFHPGVDYRANVGTPIHAILPGTVNEVGFDRFGYGKYIVLVHHLDNKTLFSLYAHMSNTELAVGDIVKADDIIGEVGLTGHTTGPHLHFELHEIDHAVNPLIFFANKALAMIFVK